MKKILLIMSVLFVTTIKSAEIGNVNEDLINAAFFYHNNEIALKKAQDALDRGADVNYVNSRGMTPLMTATGLGYINMINLLFKNGADLDLKINDQNAMKIAIERHMLAAVKLLLELGADSSQLTDQVIEDLKKYWKNYGSMLGIIDEIIAIKKQKSEEKQKSEKKE